MFGTFWLSSNGKLTMYQKWYTLMRLTLIYIDMCNSWYKIIVVCRTQYGNFDSLFL